MPEPSQKSVWAQIGEYASLGVMLPACIVVGYYIGVGLDYWLHTHFLYIVFLLLGIAAGFVQVLRIVLRKPDN